jgi:hypothetical protein
MRTYPYKAWVLMPSFKPVEIEFVGACDDDEYCEDGEGRPVDADPADITSGSKIYRLHEIYTTKQAAIAAGRALLVRMREAIEKLLVNLDKKSAALNKASK